MIGNHVTVGHNAVVHGCTIGDNSLIGMNAVIMNNAVIGKNCIVGACALVTQNAVIPDGSLVMGCPAAVTRMLTPEEIASNTDNARHYVQEAAAYGREKTESIRKNRSKSNRITNNAVRFSVADDFSQQPRCRINTHENPRNLKFYRYFRFRDFLKSSFKYYLAVQPKKMPLDRFVLFFRHRYFH